MNHSEVLTLISTSSHMTMSRSSKSWWLQLDDSNGTTSPVITGGASVRRVTAFLGVCIEKDLTWGVNTTELVKKAQRRLRVLRDHRPETAGISLPLHRREQSHSLVFQMHTRKSSRGSSRLLRELFFSSPLLEVLHHFHCTRKARNMLKDTSWPAHWLKVQSSQNRGRSS